MIVPGETEAGSAGKQPCRGIAWWAHRNDDRSAAASLPRSSKKTHRIGRPQCLENPKPPSGPNADETESTPLQAGPERLPHCCITVRTERSTLAQPAHDLGNSPVLPIDSAIEPEILECTPAMPRGVQTLKHLSAENAALYRGCLRKAA